MSLISVHRSPSPTSEESCPSDTESNEDVRTANSSSVGVKSRSLSECYFIVRGAAVILSHSDQASVSPRSPITQSTSGPNDIEIHLQGMLRVLRPEDTLSMAVRLQCAVENHVKYLAVLSTVEDETEMHEAALLGFDFLPDKKISIGVAVPIHSFSKLELDGDGGITVTSNTSPYLFKPVSIQSMWSLFQCLHKELALASLAAKSPLFCGATSYHWLNYYHSHVTKDDSIRAQWHYSLVDEAAEGDIRAEVGAGHPQLCSSSCKSREAEKQIYINLKQIMQSVDLDAVTSKDIRKRLEQQLKVESLSVYKEFIDREMLTILGQLDKPSKIFDYLYLGTEWNASNWEELKANKVEYILNVTKDVDNFFPSQFKYLKIWVSDEATTELLMHWQKTYDFIKEAKDRGSAVLVHCNYNLVGKSPESHLQKIMKEYGWSLETALNYVKDKRNCITPNSGFMEQLMTFHGVLSASNNRHSAFFNPATVVDSLPNSLISSSHAGELGAVQRVTGQLSSSAAETDSSNFDPFLHTSANRLSTKCERHSFECATPAKRSAKDMNLNIKVSSAIPSNQSDSTIALSPSTNSTVKLEESIAPLEKVQEAPNSKSILLRYQPDSNKPKVSRLIVRHKSTGTITSAKHFFGSKSSASALTTDPTSKRRASSLIDDNTHGNKIGHGRVKQHKENFENRLKNFKGKTQTATSFVSSIAKEISRLSISMSVGQTDINCSSTRRATTFKEAHGCSSIRNKVKAFNNKSISHTNQQHKRNVQSLVNEFERGTIAPPTVNDGVRLRKVSKQKSPLCNETLIRGTAVCSFTAQVLQS